MAIEPAAFQHSGTGLRAVVVQAIPSGAASVWNYRLTLRGFMVGGAPLSTIEITLSDALAAAASGAGLLSREAIERLLPGKLASDRVARLQESRVALAADLPKALTRQEINEEISA
jgi:hypothetical protein